MRWWHKTLLTLLILLLLLTAGGYWAMRQIISAAPLQDLNFTISALSWRQLHLANLSFTEPKSAATIELNDIRLQWQLRQLLQGKVRLISIGGGQIKLSSWPTTVTTSESTPETTAEHKSTATSWQPADLRHWQLPANLPEKIVLDNISVQLPCSDTLCQYLLQGSMNTALQQADIQLTLSDPQHAIAQGLNIRAQYHFIDNLPRFDLNIGLDNSVTLQLQQQLSQLSPLSGDGELKLDIRPPSDWLVQQFQLWQLPLASEDIARFNAPVSLYSNWQLELPETGNMQQLLDKARLQWQLHAKLPDALSLPGLGLLQGSLDAEIGLSEGEITSYQLNSQLSVLKPQLPQQLTELGSKIDAISVNIRSTGAGAPALTSLPLQLSVHTEGNTSAALSTAVMLNLTPPLTAQFKHTELKLRQNKLTLPSDVAVSNIALQSRFNAYWLADNWLLDINQLSVEAAKLSAPDVAASRLKAQLNKARITGDTATPLSKLSGEFNLSAGNVTHFALKALSWQWHGKIDGKSEALTVNAQLSNSAGLQLAHQLEYDSNTRLSWQLQEIFLLAGNPLAATFSQWPPLLELNRGKLQTDGQLKLQNGQLSANARLALSGVNGLYDTTLFKQLSAEISADVQQDKLTLSTTATRVGEINRGLVAGPLELTADYQADTASPLAGLLTLQQAELELMGGKVSVRPATLALTAPTQQLNLDIRQIDITQLLAQHPTTDLSGNGRVSGTVPLLISNAGATVTAGTLAAETPGGVLQYRPAGAAGMAASNPGMKVMLQALDDFHYSVLASEVSYDTNGKLLLALTLKGSNPALEKGRPINLTINLEEDLPALMTSLQLSSQISDKIKQRVQQRIQQQRANSANGAKP